MVFLLLKFAGIVLLSIPYGIGVYTAWYRYACRQPGGAYSFSLITLSGLMTCGVVASWLSLLMPLAELANMLILAGGLLLWWLQRKTVHAAVKRWRQQIRAEPVIVRAVFLVLLVFALYLSSRQSLAYDEGLYYIQFIKWMQQYPVVPGLANLHERFGFNSHWHVISALFNWHFITGQAVNQLNGLLYLLVALYLLPALGAAPRGISWWMKAGLLAGMHLPVVLVYNMTAPAPDMAVFYLCALLLVLWMEAIADRNGEAGEEDLFFIFLCAVFLVTVKISAITVLLLPACHLIRVVRSGAWRQAKLLVVIAVWILLPWLIRNVILSGYLVFPFEKADLFSFDWKYPAPGVGKVRELIKMWAFYLVRDPAVLSAATFQERVRIWFLHNLRIYDQCMLLVMILLPFALWWRRCVLPAGLRYWVLFLYAGAGCWFFSAPDPRFAYGFLVPACILMGYLLLMNLRSFRYLQLAIIVLLLAMQAATLLLYGHLHRQFMQLGAIAPVAANGWWMPPPCFQQKVVRHTVPFIYYTPDQSDRCWDAPLPCTWQLPEGVELRGKTLEEGFRVR
ncbi:hypothetical protein [uncultured Chitinophaga sp.]|jgi:hypothetical protein|uniref:LIC_10190 family membrane protein n=1 Tax=uncultured Chitinophaga sp. TaxID=339340 RepID=UPI002628EB2C|nr:hypothetical protein [uncultured Chitinophaga sp.]